MRKLILVALSIALLFGAIALAGQTVAGDGATMHNCPEEGQWAISVWAGDETDAGEALGTCGNIEVAYALTPTGAWLRYIADAPMVNTLDTLGHLDAVIALGDGAPAIVEPVFDVTYDRQHSIELPNLADLLNLEMRVFVVGGGGGSQMPQAPDAVVQIGNGDVMALWTDRTFAAATEICFYNEGTPLDDDYCETAPKAAGSGHIYNVELTIGADQTYSVSINHDYQYWYCGRGPTGAYRYCRVSSADSIPYNPTCPDRWVLHNDQGPTCPGYPDAEFGAFECDNPPEGEQYCNIFD